MNKCPYCHSPTIFYLRKQVENLERQLADLKAKYEEPVKISPLSSREIEVLKALNLGLGYQAIADRLEVKLDTVRTYIRRLYSKLGAHSSFEALKLGATLL